MKMKRHLLPFLLILFFIFCTGCSQLHKTDVEEVVLNELDLLKNLDSDTAMKYISYKELFPDATGNTELSDKIKDVFLLFFQNFDYKILDIHVDQEEKTAVASLELSTTDAETLAKDFRKSHLESEILLAADAENTKADIHSLEERYLLLNDLLTTNEYDSIKRDCTIELRDVGEEESQWEIVQTYSLENDLVGGLITYLSDPDILSPEDTLKVYLNTLKKMSTREMCSYLGVSSLLNTDDDIKNEIAAALTEQVHKNFDYEIIECTTDGYLSSIEAELTTFDSDAIMESYRNEFNTYLSEVDAVLDGPEIRYEKSCQMLLSHIRGNTAVTTSTVTFALENDGASWKLKDNSEALGNAIFGTLSSTPTEEDTEEFSEEASE